jgi:hypothetical protein
MSSIALRLLHLPLPRSFAPRAVASDAAVLSPPRASRRTTSLRRALFGLSAVSVLVGLPADAAAFCRSTTCKGATCTLDDEGCPADGKKLFWDTSCVGFSFDEKGTVKLNPDKARAAIRSAFFEWSSIDCPDGSGMADIRFVELEDVSCRVSAYNAKGPNVNVVLYQDDSWRYRGEDNTLAKTTVTFDPNSGQILDADIEINTAINPVTVQDPEPNGEGFDPKVHYDLQSLMTHEIGHFLGIAHSPYQDATMFASYIEGTIDLRSLSEDDRDAVCAAYPPGRGAFCDPTPRGGLMTDCATDLSGAPKEGGCAVSPTGPHPAVTGVDPGIFPRDSRGLLLSAILLGLPFLRRRIARPTQASPLPGPSRR